MRALCLTAIVSACSLPLGVSAQMTAAPEASSQSERIGPRISVSPESVEFGQIDDAKVVEQVVTVTNTGDETLRIPEADGVRGSCGCTIPRLAKYVLEPGESVDMTVRFDPRNRKASQNKTITIRGDGVAAPTSVGVNAFVIERVQVVEGLAQFGAVDQGDGASTTVRVRGMDTSFEVTEAQVSRDDVFQVTVLGTETVNREHPLTGEPTAVGETTLQIDLLPDAPAGRVDGQLIIRSSDDVSTEKTVRVVAVVTPDVRLDPPVLRLGALTVGSEFSETISVFSNKGNSFKIERVVFVTSDMSQADKEQLSFDVQPLDDGSGRVGHAVTVSGPVTSTMRIIRGKLVMVTDAPNQRVVSAQVAGVVRAAQ
ncbi:MAG: DUF1573 domain-containing protein [Planctomycetota bacterium]